VSIDWRYGSEPIGERQGTRLTNVAAEHVLVFTLTTPDDDWPPGDYEASIAIDEAPSAVLHFSIPPADRPPQDLPRPVPPEPRGGTISALRDRLRRFLAPSRTTPEG
jgi:hypothetical protein